MRMHSPKFKKTIMNSERQTTLPYRRSALALRARQTATPKSFPHRLPFLYSKNHTPDQTAPETATTPPPAETRSIPATEAVHRVFRQQKEQNNATFHFRTTRQPGEYQPQPQQAAGKKGCSYPRERRNSPRFPPLPAKKPSTLPGGNRGLKENPKTNTAPPKPKTRHQPALSRMVG